MTDAIKRDNTPPHYAADADSGCFDEALHVDVRVDRPSLPRASLPVRHFQRPPGQPAPNDDRRPGADSCIPEASLLSLLEELPSLGASYQTTTLSTTSSSASGSSSSVPHLEWLRDIAWQIQRGDPKGIAGELRTDPDMLMAILERLTGDPGWR